MRRMKKDEKGVALISAILLLMVLSALAAGLVYMTNTETLINSNFRQEQIAIFAARAGMEEARDRMMASNANTIFAQLPTSAPSAAGGVLYIINDGGKANTVKPWQQGNAYMDDELCHDGYNLPGLQSQAAVAPGIRCSGPSTGASWYSTVSSTAPWAGTSAALPYKWVRIAMKLNGSIQNYMVNSGASATAPVCWNGTSEIVLTAATCAQMVPTMNPVYLVTSLAVSPTGAREMSQAELALNPSQPLPYGLFATGTGCGTLSLTGGTTTDSYTDANGGTYAGTHTSTGGDIGSNGNVSLAGSPTQIGGSIGMPNSPPSSGPCPGAGLTTSGGAGMVTNAANVLMTNNPPVVSVPAPPAPNPLPPTTNSSYSKKGGSLVPGSYGNISVTAGGTLSLAPGTYSINSISLQGNATIAISPSGQVVINLAGQGTSLPLDLTGGGVTNPSFLANNFQINYSGTGTLKIAGGSQAYMVVNAPNASVELHGNSDVYGAIVANTISDTGGTSFHYDKSVAFTPQSAGYLNLISMRDVPY